MFMKCGRSLFHGCREAIMHNAVLGIFMILMVTTGAQGGTMAEWLVLDENADSVFSYDKSAVAKPVEGVVRITARVVYTEEGKAEALKMLGKGFERLFESRYVYDLNCTGGTSRLIGVTHLDDGGAPLKAFDLSAVTGWEEIAPATRLDLISELACQP
jgi:hypothetical protein